MTKLDTDPAAEHKTALIRAVGALIRAEQDALAAKSRLAEAKVEKAQADAAEEKARAELKALLDETGEVEAVLPYDALHDVKVSRTAPRESVQVTDVEAVPDEWCKIERKPKLLEIKERLKSGEAFNWAKLVPGEEGLTYKLVRKGGHAGA